METIAAVERPARAVKKKEPPFMTHRGKPGTEQFIQPVMSSPETYQAWGPSMCPYTRFIPVDYITSWNRHINSGHFQDYEKVLKFLGLTPGGIQYMSNNSSLLASFLRTAIINMGNTVDEQSLRGTLTGMVNSYLRFDRHLFMSGMYNMQRGGISETVLHSFSTGVKSFHLMRSYSMVTGLMTVISGRDGNTPEANVPECMLVCPKENYLYQKYHLLTKGTIDLSRCILFVNRELDSTSHRYQNLRTLFRRYLEPFISTHAIEVFKVPADYIVKNCFVGPFELKSQNITEREAEVQEVINSFLEQRKHP